MADAPWWGGPVIAGCFLIIGGLLTYVFSFASESRKARREARERWHKELLDEACRLIDAAQRIALDLQPYLFEGLAEDASFRDILALSRLRARHPELLTRLIVLGEHHLGDDGQAILACAVREALRRKTEPFDGETQEFSDAKYRFIANLTSQIGIKKERLTLLDKIADWRWVRKHRGGQLVLTRDFEPWMGSRSGEGTDDSDSP